MLKRSLLFLFCVISLEGMTQSLASLNYNYLYDAQNEIDFPIKIVNDKNQLTVYFKLQLNRAQDNVKDYSLRWERRDSYIQKEGTPVPQQDSTVKSGTLSFPLPEKAWLLVARIYNADLNKHWTYFQVMDSKYPVDGFLEDENGVVFSSWVKPGKEYTIHASQSEKPVHFFFYRTNFSPALPPFADKDSPPDRFLFADSSFRVGHGQKISFRSPGLYLAQQDTIAAQGFAIRVVDPSFPKITKMTDFPAPLIFISTQQEHDELVAAKDEKPKIDKVILDITGDRSRGKDFMKRYFRQVELANYYFTSYKEGWKTDRGMIFMIFGLPDEVLRTGANETWIYKTNSKERFTFLKSGSVYDPQLFTLMRKSTLAPNWYSMIDLWRKDASNYLPRN